MLKRILPIITIVALALPVAGASAKPPAQAHSSIVGGQNASIDDWPSISFILAAWDQDGDGEMDGAAGCTGTVINPSWVISAAHCLFRPDGEPVDALVTLTGTADKTGAQGGEVIVADKVVVNPNWSADTLLGDALLIHLKSRSSRPAMKLAVPGGPYVTVENLPNAAGWGTTDENSTIGTDVLKEAYLELQSDETCAAILPEFDPATQTCAGTPNTAGACKGDSGGPLIVFDKNTGEPYLWGLTSFGPQPGLGLPVCSLQAPAYYSWIPAVLPWITKTLSPPQPGGGPTGPGPVIRPPRDTTAPVVSGARLSKKKLKRRRGGTLSFDVSEAAAVTVTIIKKKRRVASIPLPASAGHVTRKLSTKALKRGSYKLQIVAIDAAGNRSRPATIAFKIVR
ncbi:MAG TPA: serine protease [Solirubrobacteraceae bacterium]|nr:serine protease [Solirubrobacteraceae bacterium]